MDVKRGDLVSDGAYMGVVLEVDPLGEVKVFMGNGLTILDMADGLTTFPLPDSSAVNNFQELLTGRR